MQPIDNLLYDEFTLTESIHATHIFGLQFQSHCIRDSSNAHCQASSPEEPLWPHASLNNLHIQLCFYQEEATKQDSLQSTHSNPLHSIFIAYLPIQPRNLFLIDYYKINNPISNDEFKEHWDSLPRDQKKVHVILLTCLPELTPCPQKWETASQEAHKVKKAAKNVSG